LTFIETPCFNHHLAKYLTGQTIIKLEFSLVGDEQFIFGFGILIFCFCFLYIILIPFLYAAFFPTALAALFVL